jgi:zinc transport system substrate-binding protein
MTFLRTLPALFVVASIAGSQTAGAAPRVATDILPVHSIVARVMQGVGVPEVIVPPGASPHGFAMRPSAAGLLAEADAVFWIGPALTPWLDGAVDALAGRARVLTLADVDGVVLLDVREGGPFAAHDHGQDEHDPMHDHEERGEQIDAHAWLDPRNGVAMAAAAAALLGGIDPANAAAYDENARAFAGEMAALEEEIAARLGPVADRPYVVFHDAYQYFEARFDMPAVGSVALGDADQPSAARVAAIRERIRDAGVVCVFAEPQFEPRLIATVTEGTGVRTATLDPVGTELAPGPDLYPDLLRAMADGLADCLGD